MCARVCVCVFQSRVQQLSKTEPLVEEMQTKIRSLEDAKGWLERRLKETEVPSPAKWNPSRKTPPPHPHPHPTPIREQPL